MEVQSLISQMFAEHDIVPTLIDRAPRAFAKITYYRYPNEVIVNPSSTLPSIDVRDAPEVHWDAQPTQYHALLMIDPDSPNRTEPQHREMIHWFVVNIPGKQVELGDVMFHYLPVFPRDGTGLHRYIFLIYEHHRRLDFYAAPQWRNQSLRSRFSTRGFASHYMLDDPIAGSFFVAQHDNYVPVILQQYTECSQY